MSDHKSTELNELLLAMSKAQGEIKVAVRDSNNPFFNGMDCMAMVFVELYEASIEQEWASCEGSWMKYMEEHVTINQRKLDD